MSSDSAPEFAPESATPGPAASSAPTSSRTRDLVTAALMAAVMAALGPVAISIGAVPITLQVFPVVLAALLLRWQWAAASMGIYLVLGAIGVPVFSHGTGGLGVLFGPTGGFIFGFVVAATAGSMMRIGFGPGGSSMVADIAAAVTAIVVIYLAGWAWLSIGPAHLSPLKAFAAGVAPFVIPDLVKAVVAVFVAISVRRATQR
jgi:biotin transport system substrate-specific component